LILREDEFDKVKHPETCKYKVYHVSSKMHYTGHALIAAGCAIEAEKIRQRLVAEDPRNVQDTWGFDGIAEDDFRGEYSDEQGLLYNGVSYLG
jgi:hypothetical protein